MKNVSGNAKIMKQPLIMTIVQMIGGERMIKLKYDYCCSVCPNMVSENHNVRLNCEIPKPSLPNGWYNVNNQLVCNLHNISIRNKKQAAPEEHHMDSSDDTAKGGV